MTEGDFVMFFTSSLSIDDLLCFKLKTLLFDFLLVLLLSSAGEFDFLCFSFFIYLIYMPTYFFNFQLLESINKC